MYTAIEFCTVTSIRLREEGGMEGKGGQRGKKGEVALAVLSTATVRREGTSLG